MSLHGYVEPGYERVAEEFRNNFSQRGELGAAFAATYEGRLVVDLWGGVADSTVGRPWSQDTLQLVFSGTKGLTATCLLVLIERGKLSLDEPVARYWPEFASEGKAQIRVADVVSHRAGLPGLATPLLVHELTDGESIATRLAAQPPFADERATRTYHPLTFGWLCGELVRRVDGRSLGRFFAQEIAAPLDLDVWIGLPDRNRGRVTRLELADDWGTEWPRGEDFRKDALLASIIDNPPLVSQPLFWNSPAIHACELPAGNAIGTARSIARFYGCLALGGELEGHRILTEKTLQLGRERLFDQLDAISGFPSAFGVGFMLQTPDRLLGPPGDAFGHTGLGGSCHGAWPTLRIGFSYAMNRMRDDRDDERSRRLLDALHECARRSTS